MRLCTTDLHAKANRDTKPQTCGNDQCCARTVLTPSPTIHHPEGPTMSYTLSTHSLLTQHQMIIDAWFANWNKQEQARIEASFAKTSPRPTKENADG
jgi:hypothetical protein